MSKVTPIELGSYCYNKEKFILKYYKDHGSLKQIDYVRAEESNGNVRMSVLLDKNVKLCKTHKALLEEAKKRIEALAKS